MPEEKRTSKSTKQKIIIAVVWLKLLHFTGPCQVWLEVKTGYGHPSATEVAFMRRGPAQAI
jgi:hypothetical protein